MSKTPRNPRAHPDPVGQKGSKSPSPTESKIVIFKCFQKMFKCQKDSDEDKEDIRICEIDKRIEMRKKILAEEKENDSSQ